MAIQKITPNFWFNTEAEEAANYYTSIFPGSSIQKITHYLAEGQEITKKAAGSVMTVEFNLGEQNFVALNGGPDVTFNEAISFVIDCKDQEEVDYYWEKLKQGGDENAQQCGWLKDRYGVSWQVVPSKLNEIFDRPDEAGRNRAMRAMLEMKKLDIRGLEDAYAGT